MKYLTILPFILLISTHAQDTFISNGKVNYDIIRTYNKSVQELKASLLFNSSYSVFNYKSITKNEQISQSETSQFNDYDLHINVVYFDTLGNSIFYDKNLNTVIKSALDFNSNKKVYIKNTIDKLDWEIGSETKKIHSFECLKATLKIGGTNYIAWFTTEIPTSFGPYSFGQLLGLILELYSEDLQLYIAATKITYPFKQNVTIPNDSLDFISESEYYDLRKQYLNNKTKSIKEKAIRILTKSPRGVSISNVKVETNENFKH